MNRWIQQDKSQSSIENLFIKGERTKEDKKKKYTEEREGNQVCQLVTPCKIMNNMEQRVIKIPLGRIIKRSQKHITGRLKK
ncbi:MAG: hypothetical protein GY757_26270 [bacterium]|nr:hypothetical protein [bacterium]